MIEKLTLLSEFYYIKVVFFVNMIIIKFKLTKRDYNVFLSFK